MRVLLVLPLHKSLRRFFSCLCGHLLVMVVVLVVEWGFEFGYGHGRVSDSAAFDLEFYFEVGSGFAVR